MTNASKARFKFPDRAPSPIDVAKAFLNPGRRFSRLSPTARILLSFLAVILLGALALKLPWSTPAEKPPLDWVDALYVSTSAVCVTGLSPIDVGTQLSGFGQAILLVLIQLGGLGFLTLSTGVLLSLGLRSSLLDREALAGMWSGGGHHKARSLLRSILITTVLVEFLGGVALTFCFAAQPTGFPLGKAVWYGFFHSVSAFCNAGFSVFSPGAHDTGNLSTFTHDGGVNVTVITLIILGGLGFLVLHDLYEWVRRRGKHRLSLHSKIVLSTSFVLTVIGAVLLFLAIRHTPHHKGPWTDDVLPSLFQSVTARTAGFNTVDIQQLAPTALLVLMALMFIGGSPGSCAGGVKTTTAYVLYRLVLARLSDRRHPVAFGREISAETVTRAATLVLIAFGCLAVLGTGYLVLESDRTPKLSAGGTFMDLMFEAVSAFGTVGLSTGATVGLTPASKLLTVFGMYIGRLGPLTVFVALAQPPQKDKVRYPDEPVLVG
ncbi:MAG: potassium-transporting ATPase subunit KdpA [Planctomycetes bacterium]|nr:potassium-transporting ATPase subunit KdpA [Planctomycetota bacterium]